MLQYMEATGVLEDYDSDGDDYERRPMSRVPQLQLMPGKYVRSLCDVDPTIQMLHRIGEVAEKDRTRCVRWWGLVSAACNGRSQQ